MKKGPSLKAFLSSELFRSMTVPQAVLYWGKAVGDRLPASAPVPPADPD